MSAVSMANVAIARREATVAGAPAHAMAGLAAAAAGPLPSGTPPPDNPVTAAMKLITSYIPTEILTLYVAAVAIVLPAAGSGAAVTPTYRAAWLSFYVFLVLAPVVTWVTFAAKWKAAHNSLPWALSLWPKWEMLFSAVAFVAWAAALPSTPFVQFSWYSSALAGFLVLVATTAIGLLASLV